MLFTAPFKIFREYVKESVSHEILLLVLASITLLILGELTGYLDVSRIIVLPLKILLHLLRG